MSTLTFDVLWRDRGASKGMKTLGDTTEKTNKQFTAFGKIAAASALVAGAALIKFGKDSVKAYSEAQTSQAKLQDAFARFPKLADTNIKALQGLNSELAKKTRFDDDATASGQAVLAQFQLTGQEITQLTPLLQDYAAKTGRDLPTAAKVLGKAMLGNGRALKDVGINFKDTGDRGKNFEQIMGGLRTQVGGFAEKEGKTAAGQVEILKNQFGELQEAVGEKLMPHLSKAVGLLIDFVGFIGENKNVVGPLAAGIAAVAGSIALVVAAAKGVRAVSAAFDTLSISAKGASIAAGGVGIAISAATILIGHYAKKNAEAKQATDSFTEALIASNGAIDDNVRALAIKALRDEDAFDNAEKLGISLQDVTDAALGNDDAMRRVMTAVDNYAASVDSADTKTQDQVDAANELADALLPVREQFDEGKRAAGQFGEANQKASRWIYDAGQAAKDAEKKMRGYRDSLFDTADAAAALEGSQDGVEAAIDDVTEAAKRNGKTMDNNTEKGRDNRQTLRNLATASREYIRKLDETGASTKKVDRATDDARRSFIKGAEKMGLSRKEAEKLADKYGLVDRRINNLNDKKITIKFGAGSYSIGGVKYSVNLTSPSSVGRSAAGGPVHGPGTGTSDSIPMMLSDGEFVVNAKATKRHRTLLEQINAASLTGQSFRHSAAPTGMRAGGVVTFDNQGPGGAVHAASQAAKYRDAIAQAIGKDIGSRAAKKIAAWQNTMGGGGGVGTIPAGPGWGPVYAAARRAGARSFTTYAGHDQGASRSRDIWPPSWAVANAIRRLQSVWYTIYSRRIASVTRANRAWLPYHGSNPHTDHVHVTLRPGFNKGGEVKNNLAKAGVPPNLVRVSSGGHGGGPGGKMGGDTYIINAPHYVGDKKDLVKALTDLNRQGRLEVVRR